MYKVTNVAVAATGTIIWQTSTGVSPDAALGAPVFQAHPPNDPLPIMVIIPTGATLVPVSAVGGAIGSNQGIAGPATIPFNVVGNDEFIGAIAGTGTVGVVVGRQ